MPVPLFLKQLALFVGFTTTVAALCSGMVLYAMYSANHPCFCLDNKEETKEE